ncbi:hypothetical protein L249_6216 [Ophiocordyceps polyrhachis-furcata BCC 54312]|uniref:Fork-head domain-containing protein n=1 Tax=Ophiocordyceps polyrhachis-furcata BCC 54312 TaxID=1330021 RepID=A0A367L0Z2_9HYPO|nr:hypothetical protein L249_6216 [Ophiocordyceps polyrhachis-furcata BCC 54312]
MAPFHGNPHVFPDSSFFDPQAPMTSHAPMPDVTKRRPLSACSPGANVLHLQPPLSNNGNFSPLKAQSSSPLQSTFGNKLNMVPMAPPAATAPPSTDDLHKRPQLTNLKSAAGKENVYPHIFPAPSPLNLSVQYHHQHQHPQNHHHHHHHHHHHKSKKRALMEPAPIKDSRPPKRPKITDDAALPPHDSFPPITDDGAKPPHSYAQLIGMAILRSPLRRLTLAQIYKWISDNYSFYNPNDAGWQNSIRHNLSLHKNFNKIERPKDDPGKGNYWGIEPGTEHQFLREKPTRKSAPTAENIPVMSTRFETAKPPAKPPFQEPTLPPPPPPPASQQPSLLLPPALPPAVPVDGMPHHVAPVDVSSDATIPVSDLVASDETLTDKAPADNELPPEPSLCSPLPPTMHSSPPVAAERRAGTPPSDAHNPSSVTRSHKRRFASMDDSGYISSLDSSVMRPNAKAMLLTSEADRPRIKRGRAEEEIARLRGSSPFSPTKSRSFFTTFGPVSSSPLRQANENHMMAPLTPLVKMAPPARPPPSASPNTNLRIHRDSVRNMLQSPQRRVDDNIPWSPSFNLDDTLYALNDTSDLDPTADFDIFQDMSAMHEPVFPGMNPLETGSPIKRSSKRPRPSSAQKRPMASAPLLRVPEQSPSQFLETPSKAFDGLASPSRLFGGSPLRNTSPSSNSTLDMAPSFEWPSLILDSNEFMSRDETTVTDFSGLDILQGFAKIGSGAPVKGGGVV